MINKILRNKKKAQNKIILDYLNKIVSYRYSLYKKYSWKYTFYSVIFIDERKYVIDDYYVILSNVNGKICIEVQDKSNGVSFFCDEVSFLNKFRIKKIMRYENFNIIKDIREKLK